MGTLGVNEMSTEVHCLCKVGGGVHELGQEVDGKSLYLPLCFAVNLKML